MCFCYLQNIFISKQSAPLFIYVHTSSLFDFFLFFVAFYTFFLDSFPHFHHESSPYNAILRSTRIHSEFENGEKTFNLERNQELGELSDGDGNGEGTHKGWIQVCPGDFNKNAVG
jgi:hypothetical protein